MLKVTQQADEGRNPFAANFGQHPALRRRDARPLADDMVKLLRSATLLAITMLLVPMLRAQAAAPAPAIAPDPARWSAAKANTWYAQQPWLVGANYVPSDAINQLEMFQDATWNPALNEKELGLAEGIGMNTMRVFLQDQLWQQDHAAFLKRLDAFLTIAAKHHIKPMLVLFDSCWDPNPALGPQHPPIPGVHNSGWVQSPGARELGDPAAEPLLEGYVKGIVGHFASDPRILAWDIWNEPDNTMPYFKGELAHDVKVARVNHLLPLAFAWARSQHPSQPLTSAPYYGDDWAHPEVKQHDDADTAR